MPGGNLESMTSSDKQGTLDKYFYSYNNAGLISGIDRNRRGLDKVSGRYEYSYDAIGRLTKTTHDGITKDSYEYDAFGNRTAMSEIAADTSENIKTVYTYDVLDRLIETKELNSSQAILKTYDYDNRGNQTKEFINGILQKSFTFDATNMLSKVVDKDKGELENFYNGLGFRVASIRPEERIEYLCDLSKDYYNLLERTVNGETESFVYDNNVISMSKSGNNFYYLQDELGSPMYMTGTDGVAVSAYAFDDFGRNINPFTGKVRNSRNNSASKHAYTTNGNIIQPFAFTGYQEDEVSGLKFAQARYYSADNGRFQSEDNVKGFIDSPFTINHYGYCWGNPVGMVDRNGNFGEFIANALDKAGDTLAHGISTASSAVVSKAKEVGKYVVDHKAELAKTGIKVAAGVAIGVGCVVAAPFVASAVATAFAGATISATAATIITTTVAGAAISGGTSLTNEVIDHGIKNVNWSKVLVDTASGAVKGAITGGLGVLGLGGVAAFATKAVVNVGVDIASSWGNAVLDHESYTATDAIKTGLTSVFSTTVGHFIGKIKWPSEKLVGGLGIDVKDGSAKNIYQGLSKIEPLRAVGGLHGVAQVINNYKGGVKQAIVAYIASNFLNYNRGLIQKTIQKIFGVGYDQLADITYNKFNDLMDYCGA